MIYKPVPVEELAHMGLEERVRRIQDAVDASDSTLVKFSERTTGSPSWYSWGLRWRTRIRARR